MTFGPEYVQTNLAGDLAPDDLLALQPTVTSTAGVLITDDLQVTVRERHWLNRFKDEIVRSRKTVAVATGNKRFGGRIGDDCWDELEYRDDVVEFDERRVWEEYEDWEFTATLGAYIKWLEGVYGRVVILFDPGARVAADGTVAAPSHAFDVQRSDDGTFAGFAEDAAVRKSARDWAVRETGSAGNEQTITTGTVMRWERGPTYKCPAADRPTVTGSSTTAAGWIQVLDADTGEPLGGTARVQGLGSGQPQEVDPDVDSAGHPRKRDGHYLALLNGGPPLDVTIVHTPPDGYEVVRNSEGQSPPGTMKITLKADSTVHTWTFYDRKIKKEGAAPLPKGGKYMIAVAGGLIALIAIITALVLFVFGKGGAQPAPTTAPGVSSASSATSGSAAAGARPSLDPIAADFMQDAFQTTYTVTVHSNGAGDPQYVWSLMPPTADPTCSVFTFSGDSAVWHHADSDHCNHNVYGAQGHPGTVSVRVTVGPWVCQASYFGTISGIGPQPQPCTPR